MSLSRTFLISTAITVLSLSAFAKEDYEQAPAGGAASSTLSAGESGLIASIANRKASDNLMDQAWGNAIAGVKSLNMGLIAKAVRQGGQSIDADDQSKQQAKWAIQALGTENDTGPEGQAYRNSRLKQLQDLANNSNPRISFVKEKASQLGFTKDDVNHTVSVPYFNVPIPLGASSGQLNSLLAGAPNEDTANAINDLLKKTLGIPGIVSADLVGKVKGQIMAGVTNSDQSISAVKDKAMAEAQAQLARLGLPKTDVVVGSAILPGQTTDLAAAMGPTTLESMGFAPAGNSDCSRRSPLRALASLEVSPWDRLGRCSDNIFNMVSKRYDVLKSSGRVILDDVRGALRK